MRLQHVVHVEQFDLHLIVIVVARVGREFAHFHDGAGQAPAEMQNIFAKAFQVKRGEAEFLDGDFQKLAGESFAERFQVDAIFVRPVETPRVSDFWRRVTVPSEINGGLAAVHQLFQKMGHLVRGRRKVVQDKAVVAVFRRGIEDAAHPQERLLVDPAVESGFSSAIRMDFSTHQRVGGSIEFAEEMRG